MVMKTYDANVDGKEVKLAEGLAHVVARTIIDLAHLMVGEGTLRCEGVGEGIEKERKDGFWFGLEEERKG